MKRFFIFVALVFFLARGNAQPSSTPSPSQMMISNHQGTGTFAVSPPNKPVVISLDPKAEALLRKATADSYFRPDAIFNTVVGALLAIAVGVVAELFREWRETKRKARDDATFQRNVVLAIRRELEAAGQLYQTGIGQFVTAPQAQFLPIRLSLTQDWLTVFTANASHLGKIDAEISRHIIQAYSLLKGLIEEFRINNEGLAALEQSRLTGGFHTSETEVRAALTKQFGRIKETEQKLKTAVTELFALLDQRGIN